MSSIYIDILTNTQASEIAFFNATLIHPSDSRKNQHFIRTNIGGNLRRGERIGHFNNVDDNIEFLMVSYLIDTRGHLIGRVRNDIVRTRNPHYTGFWPFRTTHEFNLAIPLTF